MERNIDDGVIGSSDAYFCDEQILNARKNQRRVLRDELNKRTNVKKTGIVVRSIFEMLLEQPDGLPIKEICQRLQKAPPENLNFTGVQGLDLKSFEQLTFGCVAPIRAGWLLTRRHQWSLSAAGRSAFSLYEDPEVFMIEAGKYSARGWLSVHFPHWYLIAGRTKDRITSEYKVARRIGLRRLVGETFQKPTSWKEVLPVQRPRQIVIENSHLSACKSIAEYLDLQHVPRNEGGHAIYLPPDSLKKTVFANQMLDYPADGGMKIAKYSGGLEESTYVKAVTKGDSYLQLKLIHDHKHLTLVANLLYSEKLGPRLYDLVELRCGDNLWVAYIIQHISGGIPSMDQCQAAIGRFRELDKRGVIKANPSEGFDDEEFECPTCSNNALLDQNGEFRYIDFQNFFLGDYELFLRSAAVEAAAETHFGDRSLLRGSRYLYQSIPGVNLPAKRSVNQRIEVIKRLMDECGLSIKEKLVLDIGCNIGMMMAEYLKLGAKWCHGWDRSKVIQHTERLLLALGCTRFSTSGGEINVDQPLENDLPQFLAPSLEKCAISYLAVREHVGWLAALGRIPWSFLIYEGHEGETALDFKEQLQQLQSFTRCEVGAVSEYIDGDSEVRTVAILIKKDS
jgi:hypothetical protein